MVPTQLNITLEQAIEDSPQLREAIEKDGQIRELIQTARKLEGMVRNSGVHAAGVVIAPRPLTEDRKSTRLNSSHRCISYAVFCLKNKNRKTYTHDVA